MWLWRWPLQCAIIASVTRLPDRLHGIYLIDIKCGLL
jgi:hypothetical protein